MDLIRTDEFWVKSDFRSDPNPGTRHSDAKQYWKWTGPFSGMEYHIYSKVDYKGTLYCLYHDTFKGTAYYEPPTKRFEGIAAYAESMETEWALKYVSPEDRRAYMESLAPKKTVRKSTTKKAKSENSKPVKNTTARRK